MKIKLKKKTGKHIAQEVKCVCVEDGFCESVSRNGYCCTREQGHFGAHAGCLCDENTGAPDISKPSGHLMSVWANESTRKTKG